MNSRRWVRAFTLVEMLVVISIIALLLGLLVGGLSSALKTSKNSKQMSDLHQIFVAWTLYANQSTDQCLPGFLSVETQKNWKVSYRTKGKIEGLSTDKLDRAVTQTYPWRLAPYLDYSWDIMLGYRSDSNAGDPNALYTIAPLECPNQTLAARMNQLAPSSLPGSTAALQPSFGYNAIYIGGWWDISKNPKSAGVPRPYFTDSLPVATGSVANFTALARTIGSITLPDKLTIFCPSAYLAPSERIFKPDDTAAGAAWVTAPWLGKDRIWSTAKDDSSALALYGDQPVPLMRYSNDIATVKADGNTRLQNYGELFDAREWMNVSNIAPDQVRSQIHSGSFNEQ